LSNVEGFSLANVAQSSGVRRCNPEDCATTHRRLFRYSRRNSYAMHLFLTRKMIA
jgi:hypothetical protein